MVESPGTAPGSEPCITGAFIAIVRANPNSLNIGAVPRRCKGLGKGKFRSQTGCGIGIDEALLDQVQKMGQHIARGGIL